MHRVGTESLSMFDLVYLTVLRCYGSMIMVALAWCRGACLRRFTSAPTGYYKLMYKKFFLALMLVFNHSLMFGVTEAAHIPDEDHPYGLAEHAHQHSHEHATGDAHELSQDTAVGMDLAADNEHEHQHKHGVHVHLNCELPYSLNFELKNLRSQIPAVSKSLHQSQSYSPPVPPPNS